MAVVRFDDFVRRWRPVLLAAAGVLVVALVTMAGTRLQAEPATVALLYLFVVVLFSLSATPVPALVICIIATGCLDYFFTPPLHRIRISETLDVVALVVFSSTALIVTQLMGRVRVAFHKIELDVEERERTAETLRKQASLLDLTHDALFVRDMNDAIAYWNRGAEELYGWKREEAIGRVPHQLLKTVFPLPLAEIDAILEREGRWEGELVHTAKDGKQVIVATRWSLQQDSQAMRLGRLETNNDITSHRRAEEAVRKAQAELAHAARVMTMGEMAASIAHEVNQPLSGVVINANASLRWLALEPPDLEEARDAIRRIIRDGKRASVVIARVRALSKKASSEKEHLDVNSAIQEVVSLAEGELRRARVTLRTALAADVPLVLGDRVQLQQVVLNLVLNAIEAMSSVVDRPRELLIATRREDEQRVRVIVKDSGHGVDPEKANEIFDAFYSTKRSGMGMGLSISRTILENHGGRLWAEPHEGPGATFQFTV
jgi:two-component system, LuxR family, sensor kinase FixL